MWGVQRWVGRVARRLLTEQRGDQNVGNLGLIVVAVAIIGILIAKFVPAVEEIVDAVILKMKCALNIVENC